MKTLFFACALVLAGCSRKKAPEAQHEPAPLSSGMLAANADALKTELTRTRERALAQKELGCEALLSEPVDKALCSAASEALLKASGVNETMPASEVIHNVSEAALALDRLLERVRFLGFGDLMRRRVESDGGAPAAPHGSSAPASSAAASPAGSGSAARHVIPPAMARDQKLMLEQSPLLREAQSLGLLGRQMLRALGAYLEYGTPAERDVALAEASRLLDARPKFRLLGHELRQASVLETDPTRKAALDALVLRAETPTTRAPSAPSALKEREGD